MQSSVSRRGLIGLLSMGVALWGATRSSSAEPRKLDVKDPTAVALGYVEDTARVDAKKYPTYVAGNSCENCMQLQGKAGEAYRPCTLFPGKLVAAKGWCTGWAAEM